MTVYVDDVRHPYGRMIMCHMWADDEAELHTFASRLGLQRRWFQEPPKASWKHYDISLGVKKEALAAGAVLTDKYGPLEHEARRKGDGARLATIEAARAVRAEHLAKTRWNAKADEFNQWSELGQDEKDELMAAARQPDFRR